MIPDTLRGGLLLTLIDFIVVMGVLGVIALATSGVSLAVRKLQRPSHARPNGER